MGAVKFLPVEEQLAIIRARVEEIVPEEDLRKKLERSRATGTPLRVKQGFDPTAPDIHLGHTVGLMKCAEFQRLRHQIVLIVGDYTAQVGDPSGVSETRRRLSPEEVKRHAATYLEQYGKIVDLPRAEIRWNGEWFGKMAFGDVMQLASQFTVAQILERDDFAKRYAAGKPISLHECFYVAMQAWDSVMVKADVELGATEQKFNFLAARALQKAHGQEPQVALTVPVLVGTDGTERMSKSKGNYIGVAEAPDQQFGKVMSVPDSALPQWFAMLSALPPAEQQRLLGPGVNPRDAKEALGKILVARFHGAAAAESAAAGFRRQFSDGQLPEEIPDVAVPESFFSASLVARGLVSTVAGVSGQEAARLLAQGGVTIVRGPTTIALPGQPSDAVVLQDGDILKVGKRRYFRLRRAR